MAKQSLGKGFDALIPKEFDRTILQEDQNRVQKLLIEDIVPNPDQPRKDMDETMLAELTSSVKQFGVIQPIIVIKIPKGYKIVAGERRWRAAKAAKLTHVPAIVRSLKELEQIEMALIENLQRVDLSALEQALSVYRLQQQFNMSLQDIAKRLGKAQSTISNLSRLLRLPDEVLEFLRQGKINEGHARSILALKNYPDKQQELLRCIINNKWSVRQAEDYVTKHKQSLSGVDNRLNSEVATSLSKKLGTKVQIKQTSRGGQIVISFKSSEQLQKLTEQL